MLRPVSGLTLLLTVATALVTRPPGQSPEPTGPPAFEWATRLQAGPSAAKRAAVAELAQAAKTTPETLGSLRELLAHTDHKVIDGALGAARLLGPAAKPVQPSVRRCLETATSWSTRAEAARALAAIGMRDRATRSALLQHICTSNVPRLRGECARALAQLIPDIERVVLAKVAEGAFTENDWAIDLLRRRGDSAIPQLIATLLAENPAPRAADRRAVAREALAQIGWRATEPLERAQLPELAQRALRTGPFIDLAFADLYECKPSPPRPEVGTLPTIAWETGYGHGRGLRLWRATEGPRGLRVRMLVLESATPGAPPVAKVHETTIPRRRACAIARQLLVIADLELSRKQPDSRLSGMSTGNFYAAIRCELAAETILEAAFAGYPAVDNLIERFPAEAAVRALRQAVANSTWTTRPAHAADRAFLQKRPTPPAIVPSWFENRLEQLAAALPRD